MKGHEATPATAIPARATKKQRASRETKARMMNEMNE